VPTHVRIYCECQFSPWIRSWLKKEKASAEELSAIGKQTMAHAYSAMDYYFDHSKRTVASVLNQPQKSAVFQLRVTSRVVV
jgi:hypothetical protein